MTYLRIWDEHFKLITSATGDMDQLREAAETIMAGRSEEWLHYTLDSSETGSWRNRGGGRLVRSEAGIEWRDNREHLKYLIQPSYSLPVNVGPGDKMAIQIGGQVYTDTIESIRTTTPAYRPAPEPSRWQRFIRAITPRRWRKTTLWTPPGGTSTVITTTGDGPVYQMGKDIVLGERTTWPQIVAEMAQSEPDDRCEDCGGRFIRGSHYCHGPSAHNNRRNQ